MRCTLWQFLLSTQTHKDAQEYEYDSAKHADHYTIECSFAESLPDRCDEKPGETDHHHCEAVQYVRHNDQGHSGYGEQCIVPVKSNSNHPRDAIQHREESRDHNQNVEYLPEIHPRIQTKLVHRSFVSTTKGGAIRLHGSGLICSYSQRDDGDGDNCSHEMVTPLKRILGGSLPQGCDVEPDETDKQPQHLIRKPRSRDQREPRCGE